MTPALGSHRLGSPASAGIDPGRRPSWGRPSWLPRVRGDRPQSRQCVWRGSVAPPRPRGSTSCAPSGILPPLGSPASAGIDLHRGGRGRPRRRLPRVRGDRPAIGWAAMIVWLAPPRPRGSTFRAAGWCARANGSPASAGIDPGAEEQPVAGRRLPRVRGDRPVDARQTQSLGVAPPRPRGSTQAAAGEQGPRPGSPASAGIDPAGAR